MHNELRKIISFQLGIPSIDIDCVTMQEIDKYIKSFIASEIKEVLDRLEKKKRVAILVADADKNAYPGGSINPIKAVPMSAIEAERLTYEQ